MKISMGIRSDTHHHFCPTCHSARRKGSWECFNEACNKTQTIMDCFNCRQNKKQVLDAANAKRGHEHFCPICKQQGKGGGWWRCFKDGCGANQWMIRTRCPEHEGKEMENFVTNVPPVPALPPATLVKKPEPKEFPGSAVTDSIRETLAPKVH